MLKRMYSFVLCFIFLLSYGMPLHVHSAQLADRQEQLSFLPLHVHNFDTSLAYAEIKHYAEAEEAIQGWQIHRNKQNVGFLTLHQYKLSTGDLYYLIRYLPQQDSSEALQLSLPMKVTKFNYRTNLYPQGLDYTKSVWAEPRLASPGDKLPISALYIDDQETGSYFFSYIDVFERQNNGVRKELYSLARPIQLTGQALELQFPHKQNGIVEQWGLLSREPLVNWTNESALEDLRIADLNRVRKWSQEGSYYQTPSSYTPTSATSFFLNPAYHIGEKFLRTSGARFFEDFALVSLYTAARTQNDRGYWYMTTRSNWLYADYGIPQSYYDTRFSTDAALFLVKGYQRYQEPVFLHAAKKYGDFFLQFAEEHHFTTKNGGYLVWDYGHDHLAKTPTHVSLNHLVTEMNFLYELYQVTEEASYLELAHKLKQAVRDTTPNWKKVANGDLWYAYLINGGYGLQDYPLLTLKDLRYSQQLITEIDGEEDPDFAYLIQVKEEYLKKNNLALY